MLPTIFVENDMKRMWRELMESEHDENLKCCQGWLKYALKYQRVDSWPSTMVNICLRHGPYQRMRPRDAVKLLFFFYGNNLSFVSAGHWILIRIAIGEAQNKERLARVAIQRIKNCHRMLKRNGDIIRYFCLIRRRYVRIDHHKIKLEMHEP